MAMNEALARSPYSLPDDDFGSSRADYVTERIREIEARNLEVRARHIEQSDEIRRATKRRVRAQEVFESNKLESAGLGFSATNASIGKAGGSYFELKAYLAKEFVSKDPHLIEVLGLEQALIFAEELATNFASGVPLYEIDIRNLHRLTVLNERHAGSYKKIEVEISGSSLKTSGILEVEDDVREIVEWFNSNSCPAPLAAAVVHSWLTHIHPFEDGNGRVARLLANLVLLQAEWPPLIVRASDRLQYLDALSHSDAGGDILPLFELFVKSISRSLKELEKPDLAKKLFEAELREDPEQRYQLWIGRLERFIEQLEIDLGPSNFKILSYENPSVSKFLLLEEGDPSGNQWIAKLQRNGRAEFLLWVGVTSSRLRDLTSFTSDSPSVFVSERDWRIAAPFPFRNRGENLQLEVEEFSIAPVSAEQCVEVRSGSNVDRFTIEESATKLAVEIGQCFFEE